MATVQVLAAQSGLYPATVNLPLMSRGAGVGILVNVPSGVTASYTVLVSGDPQGAAPKYWNPHDTLGTTQTASANGNVQYPCTFIGLNVLSVSGGQITMSVVQADFTGGF